MDPKKLPSIKVAWTQRSSVDIELDNVINEILAHAKPVPVPKGFGEMIAEAEASELMTRLMLPRK